MKYWLGLTMGLVMCLNPALSREAQVLDLDGKDSYVELPAGILNSLEEATVETWIKWRTFPKNLWARYFSYGGYLTDAGIQGHPDGRLYYFIQGQQGTEADRSLGVPGVV